MNNQKPQDEKPSAKKPILLFEIDEGIGMNELTTVFGNDKPLLQNALYNIVDGLQPLTDVYEVAVLIYPTWHYYENGYRGADPTDPLNRISDELKEIIDFFNAHDMNVYLELVSSGIDTSQNGEVLVNGKAKPMPPLHRGDTVRYDGLSMDMDTLSALAKKYANFKGVRFHELIGSHDLGVAGNNHGFITYKEMLEGIFRTVKETDLELIWGDHSWNMVADESGKAVKEKAFWLEWLDMAVDIVGTEKLTLNWSNNGWPAAQYVNDTFHLKNYRGTQCGESVQSWFWQELDCGTMQWKRTPESKRETKWYSYADCDMPIELVAAFTLRALQGGARLVQYEHPQYFFNFNEVSRTGRDSYTGTFENEPDYSVKERTKRLIDMLTGKSPYIPSTDLTTYFANTQANIEQYTEVNPSAKRYYQNSLYVLFENAARVWDSYNGSGYAENSAHRLLERQIDEVETAIPFNLTFSATSETLLLKKNDKGYSCHFYNHYNGCIFSDYGTLADNENGTVKDIFAMNLKKSYQPGLDGDPDELVVIREKGDVLSVELYEAVSADKYIISLRPITDDETIGFISECLPTAKSYKKGLALTDSVTLNEDATRPIARRFAFLYESGGQLSAKGKTSDGTIFDGKLGVDAKDYVTACAFDEDMDFADEIAVAIKSGRKTCILSMALQNGEFVSVGKPIDAGECSIKTLYSQKICMYKRKY